jgi:hypothetical protein
VFFSSGEFVNDPKASTDRLEDLKPIWMETEGNVTACRFQFARPGTLTFGIAVDANRFLISFTYRAHGKDFNDEFASPVFIPQGEIIPVSYNALKPQQNTRSENAPASRNALLPLGIAMSILASVACLIWMRGCS